MNAQPGIGAVVVALAPHPLHHLARFAVASSP
jgi:hypothetical protein